MAILYSPAPIVRPLAEVAGLVGPVQLCVDDDGKDQEDRWQEIGNAGPSYLRRVLVTIRPVLDPDAPDPLRPISHLDADGQAFHCVWVFPSVDSLRVTITEQGVHGIAPYYDGLAKNRPLFLESNGGSFRIPRGVQLFFCGGQQGDPWEVQIVDELDNNLGRPDSFTLDTLTPSALAAPVAVIRPAWHESVELIFGTLTVGTTIPPATNLSRISLAQPILAAGSNTLYRTSVPF